MPYRPTQPGKKFCLVTVQLLVPCSDDSWRDLLSDFRDDHPDKLVEWSQTGGHQLMLGQQAAQDAWLDKTGETIVLPVEN